MSTCVGSPRGTAEGSSSLLHRLSPHWFSHQQVVGTYCPGTGTLGWGAWCRSGTPLDIPPKFLSATRGCGSSPFCFRVSPTSLDGCGFFNSIVVRLPFSSISDSCEWWLFYILVVIFYFVLFYFILFLLLFWCGCEKRLAMSAYTAILTGSSQQNIVFSFHWHKWKTSRHFHCYGTKQLLGALGQHFISKSLCVGRWMWLKGV